MERVLDAFGKGDVLIGRAAVAAGMADEIGTFESTLARLAAGWDPSAPVSAPKGPAPLRGKTLPAASAPKVLAPVPTRPAAPVVPPEVAADRERTITIREMTPVGAEAERDEAIRNGDSVEAFRQSLAAFTILNAMGASGLVR